MRVNFFGQAKQFKKKDQDEILIDSEAKLDNKKKTKSLLCRVF